MAIPWTKAQLAIGGLINAGMIDQALLDYLDAPRYVSPSNFKFNLASFPNRYSPAYIEDDFVKREWFDGQGQLVHRISRRVY